MALFLFLNFQCLLICLTVSSRKDYPIAPCFIGGFHFICRTKSHELAVYEN